MERKVGWMKADDQTILALHTRVITHNPRITVSHDDSLKTWQLRIRQLKESDRGCYMCQINTGGDEKTIRVHRRSRATSVKARKPKSVLEPLFTTKINNRLQQTTGVHYSTSRLPLMMGFSSKD
ncbi:hypothetical protein NQ318_017163 [Aromia moschata]|uniref:Immunoglobulin-like beta-sandwich domain-containing protein n=1 Tax=Aromia moschata TaxID=1265417 RepID=A0AAV8YQE4_9CUCU|nr:hypothetical protein NQ318_017163 [Aromia moschata]